jgi:hypothetical protein
VLRENRDVGLGEERRRELCLDLQRERVRRGHRRDPRVREVGLEISGAHVPGLGRDRIEDELIRPARVLGRRRLAVGPLHVGPDLERVGHLVGRGRPRLGEAGHGLEVLAEPHEEVVVEGENLVVENRDGVPRVERLRRLVRAHLEDEGVALGG